MKKNFLRFSALTVLIVMAIGLKSFAQVDLISPVSTEPPTTITVDDPVYSVDASSWTTGLAPTLQGYMGGAAFMGTKLYVMGGNQTAAAGTGVAVYDIVANTWTTGPSLPQARVINTGAASSTKVFCIGGTAASTYTNTIYELIPPATTWSTKVPLPVLLGWADAVTYQDSCIYILGGVVGGSTVVNTVYLFNHVNNTIRACTPMPGAGVFGGAAGIVGNTIVYAGGADMAVIQNVCYEGVINPTNRAIITWTTGTNLPVTLYRSDGGTWGANEIIVANGSPTASWVPASPNPAYTYNPATNVWTTRANKPTATLGAWVASCNPSGAIWKLVAVSGYTGSACAPVTEIFSDDFVGITTNSTAKFTVYPNPVVDMLNIASDKMINNIKVFNTAGQLVYESIVNCLNAQVNTISFTSGIYVLQMESADGISTQKFNVVK